MVLQYHQELLTNRLRKRNKHLRKWARRNNISCFRVYNRDIPELPVTIDLYEDHILVAFYERPDTRIEGLEKDWREMVLKTVSSILDTPLEKTHYRERRQTAGSDKGPDDIKKTVPEFTSKAEKSTKNIIVHEGTLKFSVNFDRYLDCGLFLDQRNSRKMIAEKAYRAKVLNLFCYTGSFSVYVAAAGAKEVTSVDISNTYLNWAKENFILNDINVNKHRFIRSDVMSFLEDAVKNQLRFDIIILDPPTFSNTKKKQIIMDVNRDYFKLIELCGKLLYPKGEIYFSTNSRKFKIQEIPNFLEAKETTDQSVPEDFQNKFVHRSWTIRRLSPKK